MSNQINVRVLFFAKCREITGCGQVVFNFNENEQPTGNDVLNLIISKYPRIESFRDSINLALNEEYIDLESKINLKNNDEIALIPPISGG